MIGALPAGVDALPARPARPVRAGLVRPLLGALVAVGLAASLLSTVALQDSRVAQASVGVWEDAVEAPRPALYYAAHSLRVAAFAAAGVLAFLVRGRRVAPGLVAAFGALLAAALLLSVRGMGASDFLSTRVVGTTGPWLAIGSLLLFAAAREEALPAIGRMLDGLAWALTALVAWEAVHLRSFLRQETVAALGSYLNALYFPAAWLVLRPYPARSAARVVRWIPAIAYAAGAVLVQTRLNLVMVAMLVLADGWVTARRTGRPISRVVELALLACAVIGVASWLAEGTRFGRILGLSFLGLAERIGEDSRSGQLEAFFAAVSPAELLLGRGARATWDWPGMSPRWAGGTDVGYLSLLFFGGLPLLAAWCAVHLGPPLRVVRSRETGMRLAFAAVALLWGVRMFSSSFPSASLDFEVVLLCVGACAAPTRRRAGDPGAVRSSP